MVQASVGRVWGISGFEGLLAQEIQNRARSPMRLQRVNSIVSFSSQGIELRALPGELIFIGLGPSIHLALKAISALEVALGLGLSLGKLALHNALTPKQEGCGEGSEQRGAKEGVKHGKTFARFRGSRKMARKLRFNLLLDSVKFTIASESVHCY